MRQKQKTWRCEACLENFHNATTYWHHSTTVHCDSNPFQCSTCKKKFPTTMSLRHHALIHDKIKPHKCTFCNYSFAAKVNLVVHLRKHTRKDLQKCEQCGKEFLSKSILRCHLITHTKSSEFICKVCGYAGSCPSALAMHEKIHTDEKPFKCSVCLLDFKYKKLLKRHEDVHNDKSVACSECPFVTRREDSLSQHIKKCHRPIKRKSYDCEKCERSFNEKPPLIDHMRMHGIGNPYFCKICKKKVDGDRTTHLRTHAEWRNRVLCPMCGKGFESKSNLRPHILRHHGQKTFTCNLCSSDFYTYTGLHNHVRTHTRESPYACAACGNEFKCFKEFKNHYKNIACLEKCPMQEPPLDKSDHGIANQLELICPFCEVVFTIYAEFEQHLKIHTKEKEESPVLDTNLAAREIRIVLTPITL